MLILLLYGGSNIVHNSELIKLDTNSFFENESVRSPSPACGWSVKGLTLSHRPRYCASRGCALWSNTETLQSA